MLVRNAKTVMLAALEPTGTPENLLQPANFFSSKGSFTHLIETDTMRLLRSGIGLFGTNFQLSARKGQKTRTFLILKRCRIYPTLSIFRINRASLVNCQFPWPVADLRS